MSAEDDMDNTAQRYLSASLQLQRPPNLCVVFDALPEAITAAHNCTMKAVAVCGLYPAYALKQADVTCGRLSELTVYNIRCGRGSVDGAGPSSESGGIHVLEVFLGPTCGRGGGAHESQSVCPKRGDPSTVAARALVVCLTSSGVLSGECRVLSVSCASFQSPG